MIADYIFYKTVFGGTQVPEEQWLAAECRGAAVVDAMTFGRLHGGAPVDNAVRMAVCAAAEAAARYAAAQAQQRPGLSGFTNDGYSESYSGTAADLSAQQLAEMQAAAGLYLPGFHPLRYAGGDDFAWLR